MRKIIVSNVVSLDGFFETENKELDWFIVGDEFFEYARNLLSEVDTILFGKVTYEMMAAYWPNTDNDDPVITDRMNNLPKVVFSKTLPNVLWNNSTLIKENIEEEIRQLKNQPGKDMVILGSGNLISLLMQHDLIDEYRIILTPVILGSGNPLFKGPHNRLDLRLLKTKTLDSGVVILFYEPKTEKK